VIRGAKQYDLAVAEAYIAKEIQERQMDTDEKKESKRLAEASVLGYPKIRCRDRLDIQVAELEDLLTFDGIAKEEWTKFLKIALAKRAFGGFSESQLGHRLGL